MSGTMIDSHCHLAAPQFADDLDAVLTRAETAGVERMVCIGDTFEESDRGVELAKNYGEIFCTVGVHPHHAKDWTVISLEKLKVLAISSSKIRAIGEIGLDYHYDFSPRDKQREVFAAQLRLAKELKMPAVVHCREAVEDVWTIVDDIRPNGLVMHCCAEKWEDVKRFVDRGYLLSFTGMATYPKLTDVHRTIKECPLDRLMVETDAPFLAPVPHRGKRNEPAFVVEVAKAIAGIKGVTLEEVDEATTQNALEFFGMRS